MHLVYVDDSKDNHTACFSALVVPGDQWLKSLDRLIGFRRELRQLEGVPLRMELHTTDWLGGKGQFVRHLAKPDRARLYNCFLSAVTMLPGIQLIQAAVPVREEDRGFERLLNRIHVNMHYAGSHAVIISDEGKNYDKLLRKMRRHNYIPSQFGLWAPGQPARNITVTRILEDIVYRDSKHSLFIQAADACVYALLRSERPIPSKTALGLNVSLMILEPIMVKAAYGADPRRLGIIR